MQLQIEKGWSGLDQDHYNSVDYFASFGDDLDNYLFRSKDELCEIFAFASNILKDGGFFFGLVFDASEIFTRTTKSQMIGKTYFQTQKDLIRVDFRDIGKLYQNVYESSDQSAEDHLGIGYEVFLENKKQTNYMIHSQTFINVAKQFGLYLVEMTNCSEFYQLHKNRWFEELKRMNAFAKPKNSILPEQRDALSLYTTFVFQKQLKL